MKTLIKNGLIINPDTTFYGSVLIEDGLITEIGKIENINDGNVIDAKGDLVIPAGVDVHTHMDLDLGKFRAVDDFYSGSIAALCGGTATIVDHIAFGPKNCELNFMIDRYHKLADGKSLCDYSFHGVIQHVNESTFEEMKKLVEEGITSFKIYMTYDNRLSDEEILRVLNMARELQATIAVHAENHGIVTYLRQYFGDNGYRKPIYHALSRPNVSESEAINRMISLSEIAGYPNLYFVHVSTKEGLSEIINARRNGAKNIYGETCTQYLTLDMENYDRKDNEGVKYIMAPPLRTKEDIEALWSGIKNKDIDVIATDHCPFMLDEKLIAKDDFRLAPGGVGGVEERIEVILTEGVKRGISLNTLIERLCLNPSKIFGIKNKGSINIGNYADITILKKQRYIIEKSNRHSKSDYTVYEGFESHFKVDKVFLRGEIVVENGEICDELKTGKFIQRSLKLDDNFLLNDKEIKE
ncbi:dihydropyrimidinase [Soehngenia saccharolytica]|jgi:dihydropyrimidinase|nr:dihydropyrimidinase [Soehngenia saccharolytica]